MAHRALLHPPPHLHNKSWWRSCAFPSPSASLAQGHALQWNHGGQGIAGRKCRLSLLPWHSVCSAPAPGFAVFDVPLLHSAGWPRGPSYGLGMQTSSAGTGGNNGGLCARAVGKGLLDNSPGDVWEHSATADLPRGESMTGQASFSKQDPVSRARRLHS